VSLFVALAATAFAVDKERPPAILGRLETKSRIVTFWAGAQARYTIRTKDGRLLAERVTATELRARFPELAKINDATMVAWAGM